jgi:hypothetical protein
MALRQSDGPRPFGVCVGHEELAAGQLTECVRLYDIPPPKNVHSRQPSGAF